MKSLVLSLSFLFLLCGTASAENPQGRGHELVFGSHAYYLYAGKIQHDYLGKEGHRRSEGELPVRSGLAPAAPEQMLAFQGEIIVRNKLKTRIGNALRATRDFFRPSVRRISNPSGEVFLRHPIAKTWIRIGDRAADILVENGQLIMIDKYGNRNPLEKSVSQIIEEYDAKHGSSRPYQAVESLVAEQSSGQEI